MTRRMSCSMTVPQVEAREKTETRRHVDTWKDLKPGDRLTLIEKGMGLAKGEKQRVLAEVIVTAVEVEPLGTIGPDGLAAEGFPGWSGVDFMRMWADGHGYRKVSDRDLHLIPCRRIAWKYQEHPFTIRERMRCQGYGDRAVNDWGAGDLPAPWCGGDVVLVTDEADPELPRGYALVTYAPSIDHGDAWYVKLSTKPGWRLHVAFKDRSTYTQDLNGMEGVTLVETSDPEGLAHREALIAHGWGLVTDAGACEECGRSDSFPVFGPLGADGLFG